jgi:hypothetical protein
MKKIRQYNDIDISVVIKNTEGEILDPSLCKGIQIRMQTNGNETQIAHYDIFEDGHIVFRFNAKDQTQIGVYDIVISATTTDGRVFTTDVCKAFCIVPCTCCTDNEPGEVEIETLEVEATIEITSWGYMCDKRVEAIEDKLKRLDNRDDKLQEQIDRNHTELGEAFEWLYDDVEENYSRKSNTLRHLTLSPIATANSMSLLLEGEYDDSVQGSHLLGPDNIILPYATESKAGVMSPEDKKALTQIIEGGGLDFIDLGDMSPAEIIKKLEDGTTGIFLVRDNTSGVADIRYTIYKTFVPNGEYSFFATKLEWKGNVLVNTVGTFGGDKNGHGGFIPTQEVLVSGQNIKTINGTSLLGSGDIVIEGGGVSGDYATREELAEVEEKLFDNTSSFFDYRERFEWTNQWIGGDGNGAQINTSAKVYFYPVAKGDKIKLSLSGIHGSSSKSYYHYAFYNSENPSADSLMPEHSYLRISGSDLNTVVEVPNDAMLIGISIYKDKINNISFEKTGEKLESLIPLQKNMEGLSDMITLPISISRSNFGILVNGQGITKEEAEAAFLGFYSPIDLKTYYIITGNDDKYISFKSISDDSLVVRTPTVDFTRDEAVVYPIFKDYFVSTKREIVGYVIINASKIARTTYSTKYVYLIGNKGEYCKFHSSYNSVTEIVLLGDSLTALGSGYANFFDVKGCASTTFGVGGENITQIMGRMGIAPFRLKEDVVIPSEPIAVSIKLISSFNDKETYPRNNYGLHECTIGGIKGSINVTTAGSAVTFTRSTSGEEVTLKAGTDIESCYYGKTNTFNVYWMGQNGYSSDDDLVDAFKLCVVNQVNNYYLVLTPHLNTSDELEQKMQRTFGNRYINMRRWCILFGLSESGITPTEADMEAISNSQCPPSLLGDGVHFVESARQAIGKMISNKVAYLIGR